MVLNYTNISNSLMAGNFTSASVQAYTLPLGAWAWFLVIFITMIAVYVKTQSTGATVIIGLLFLSLAQASIGVVGNTLFFTLIAIGLAILLFKLWRG